MNSLPAVSSTVIPTPIVSEENAKSKMKKMNIFGKSEIIKREGVLPGDIKSENAKLEKGDDDIKGLKKDVPLPFEGDNHIDAHKGGICSLNLGDNIVSNITDVMNSFAEEGSIQNLRIGNVTDLMERKEENEADLSGNNDRGRIEPPNLHELANSDSSSIGQLNPSSILDHGKASASTTVKSEESYSVEPSQPSISIDVPLLVSNSVTSTENSSAYEVAPLSASDPFSSPQLQRIKLSQTIIPAPTHITNKDTSHIESEGSKQPPSIDAASSFPPSPIKIKAEEPLEVSPPPTIQPGGSLKTLIRTDSNVTNNIFDNICGKITESSDPKSGNRLALDPPLGGSPSSRPNVKELLIIERCEKMNSETGI
jgi:hypothetical protein